MDMGWQQTSNSAFYEMRDLMAEKILIVDDSRPFRQSLNRFLAMEGFDVEEAGDGPEGLDQAQAYSPDLVVMDVNMPGMDGFEAVRRLREFSHVPVLILSARSAEMDRVLGLSAGADSYLAKPFSASELLARIQALLRRYKSLQARQAGRVAPSGATPSYCL
jgi:DNA-binding response OmpR family regulator